MADRAKIIELSLIEGNVLVTFSDGRVVTLCAEDLEDLYADSEEPPLEPV
jgi:hypothetical protein